MEYAYSKYDKFYLTITYLLFTGAMCITLPFAVWALDPKLLLTGLLVIVVCTLGTVSYTHLRAHET